VVPRERSSPEASRFSSNCRTQMSSGKFQAFASGFSECNRCRRQSDCNYRDVPLAHRADGTRFAETGYATEAGQRFRDVGFDAMAGSRIDHLSVADFHRAGDSRTRSFSNGRVTRRFGSLPRDAGKRFLSGSHPDAGRGDWRCPGIDRSIGCFVSGDSWNRRRDRARSCR